MCVYDVVYCAFRDLFVELGTLRVYLLIGINWQWKVLTLKSCAKCRVFRVQSAVCIYKLCNHVHGFIVH